MKLHENSLQTIDISLFEPDGITIEIDFFYTPAYLNADSDWDSKDHIEIETFRAYSGTNEIELDLDYKYLYDVLKEELRKITLDRFFNGGL